MALTLYLEIKRITDTNEVAQEELKKVPSQIEQATYPSGNGSSAARVTLTNDRREFAGCPILRR